MKVDLTEVLTGIDGVPILETPGVRLTDDQGNVGYVPYGTKVITEDGQDVELKDDTKTRTLGSIFIQALMAYSEKHDNGEAYDATIKRSRRAQEFYDFEEVYLEMEDLVDLKKRVHMIFPSPVVVGAVDRICRKYGKDAE